jgi:drug/metabolite transporter (DMT)-like permease
MAVWINYALMAQFAVLATAWLIAGDRMQAVYWIGALVCTAGVTFR